MPPPPPRRYPADPQAAGYRDLGRYPGRTVLQGAGRPEAAGRRGRPHPQPSGAQGAAPPMAETCWSLTAAADLQDIEAFVARDSPVFAVMKRRSASSRFARHSPTRIVNMNIASRTNCARVDAMPDEEIDTSEVPPLSEEFFRQAHWREPSGLLKVRVSIDPETLAWFQAQADRAEQQMAAALRLYADVQKATAALEQTAWHALHPTADAPRRSSFGIRASGRGGWAGADRLVFARHCPPCRAATGCRFSASLSDNHAGTRPHQAPDPERVGTGPEQGQPPSVPPSEPVRYGNRVRSSK